MKRFNLAILSLLAITSAGLAGNSLGQDSEIPAQRVLAIGGAVAEIIYALGEQDRLIARDTTSTYPPEVNELPNVGYMRSLSPEGVLSVKPDLILARANSGPPEAIEVLRSADVNWVTVPDDWTTEGVDENIRIVAESLGVPGKGARLRERLAEDLAAAQALTSDIENKKRVLFVLSMRDDRVMAAGTETAANGIIELAGGINVTADFTGYKQISQEAVLNADPDVILMMGRGGEDSGHSASNDLIKRHAALGNTRAVANDAIIRMDGLFLLGFGPRVGAAAEALAQALYGNEL